MTEQVEPLEQPETPPQPAQEPTPTDAPSTPQRKVKSPWTTVVLIVAPILVLAAAAFGVWNYLSNRPVKASVGDCVTQTTRDDASDAKLVACDKPQAKHKVIGIVKNVPEQAFDADPQLICKDYPTWQNVVWVGKKGGTGDAWCLEPLAK